MATSKKAASKKAASKKSTAEKSSKATSKKAARASAANKPAVTKRPKARMPKEKPAAKPTRDQTVNMGPLRGDNSFPPSNKRAGIPGSQGKRGVA